MAEFINKQWVAVRISLPGEDPLDGQLALASRSETRDGPQTVLEMLNSRARMIPFQRAEDDKVLLLSRRNVNWVVLGSGVDPLLVCPATYGASREESVHVTFTDGRGIDGRIQMELPEGMNRASDFLNCPEEFFALRSRLGIVLVNKSCVRDVLVLEPSPLPLPTER